MKVQNSFLETQSMHHMDIAQLNGHYCEHTAGKYK